MSRPLTSGARRDGPPQHPFLRQRKAGHSGRLSERDGGFFPPDTWQPRSAAFLLRFLTALQPRPEPRSSPPLRALSPLTLPAGSALDGDDGRLPEPLGTAAGGPQLAGAGVGHGVAAAHGLGAGAHATPDGRPLPHRARCRHPSAGRHRTPQPLSARRAALAVPARLSFLRPADAAAAARVQYGTAGAGGGQRGAAGAIAAFGASGRRRGGEQQGWQQGEQHGAPAPRRQHRGGDGGGRRRSGI